MLFLGWEDSPLPNWLRATGEEVTESSEKLSQSFIIEGKFTFLISYGYRYILKSSILELFPSRAINLHISYLPWNRGADPNLWSFVEETPKGVTIHYLDEGIDTGDIIAQQRIHFDSHAETLATSYRKLHDAIQELFQKNWKAIRNGNCPRVKQDSEGSVHRSIDKETVEHLLKNGWDTPVADLRLPANPD